ncbi:HXXEE domain-containing protein [Chloroflexia bacterium SDU3-3]|nr:HXXEE domain-containing protein [Chloroflexia bacterium SDU3-3]
MNCSLEKYLMHFMRQHWFDIGLVLAVGVSLFLLFTTLSPIAFLLWVSLAALFLHQFEEYRFPGYFPGMVNLTLFASKQPDRYPLNTNTAFVVNVLLGWLSYFLAAMLNERAIWLGIATMLVSVGNIIAHTFLFNLKGKTLYNPGIATADMLFLPIAVLFFQRISQTHSVMLFDWIVGVVLGIALNYIGILKLIDWLKDDQTTYIFPQRCLPPAIREAQRP